MPYLIEMRQLIRLAALALAVFAAFPVQADEMPEGQSKADYLAWLARDPDARAKVLSFDSWLDAAGVEGVVPTWELVRTASMWRECNGPRFEVAPIAEWTHVARTLRFVRNHVEPVIGPVEIVSGFRDEALNKCAHGAPQSAHRHFYAIDMVPLGGVTRAGLMKSLCMIHELRGREYDIGLGFYSGVRFHVDSQRFRIWGADGHAATSPCVTGNYA
jgi:hypothetical protein